ncbi:hypothetical protein [Hymenobacter metallicola]|uniref:DUF4377 domain-containing protein n=1 Tax=Hymenobacter metallicola TaxID=2563114 RepID=A0A4Z0Q9P6_9BACT|nr:hypothetical protein [Hymenobacter metallicola]TGE26424.1 hypothetical protein E5K02_16655 [Hymenobacter metallicola]
MLANTTRHWLCGLSLLAAVGLSGCSEKADVSPSNEPSAAEVGCNTPVTVRLCMGMTAGCLTDHTTLRLPDGTLVSPSGPIWEDYERNQVHDQVLSVGYVLGGPAPAGSLATVNATITCLQTAAPVNWCGTPDLYNRKSRFLHKTPYTR